jgi:hypothetical protein
MEHYQWTAEGTSRSLSGIAAFACNTQFQLCVQACLAVDSKTSKSQLDGFTFKMKSLRRQQTACMYGVWTSGREQIRRYMQGQ